MLTKILAAKTLTIAGVATFGVVAAGASAAVMAGEEQVADTTTTIVEESTTTVPEETTTTTEAADPTTTTTTVVEEPTTTVPETTTTTAEPDTTTVPERGPDPNGPARFGLCNAFGHRSEGPGGSVAAQNLRTAAEQAGQSVAEFCGFDDSVEDGRSTPSGPPAAAQRGPGREGSDDAGTPPGGSGNGKGKGAGNGRGRG